MNKLEQQLLREVTDGAKPRLSIRSQTRIDVGRWWWPRRVWLCVVGEDLIILAVARRRYIVRKPLADCQRSYYCHATGQLVIEPGEDLTFSRFKMPPREALELLEQLRERSDRSDRSD